MCRQNGAIGNIYKVLHMAKHSETLEDIVVTSGHVRRERQD